MNRTSVLSRLTALSLAALMGMAAYAQGYYDDDIYYDASKAKKETPKNASSRQGAQKNAAAQQYYYDGAQYVPWTNAGDFQAADTYQVTGTSTRDVDEYNRRTTASAQPAREVCDSITLEEFETMSNTRNLARFHDSQAAQQVYADDLGGYVDYGSAQNYGYQTPATTVVNINVPSYPYYSYYGYPYYGSSWYWNSWGYNPYYWGYDPYWGPSWSWGYPSWSWGWGGPGWGPSWGWNGPHYGWVHPRPNYTSAGAFAPNMTHNSTGNYRPSSNYRGGSVSGNRSTAAGSLGTRPSATGAAGGRGTTGAVRPGYRAPTTNPSGVVSGGSGATRGRTVSSGSATMPNRTSTNSSTHYNTNRQPSTNSNYNYNNSVTRGRSSSSGSFGSGSSRGGFSGGGASRSGGGASGGGHRGR